MPTSPEPWDVRAGLYLNKLADIMDAAGGDCVRLVVGLKELEADSTELAKSLVDANHELKDYVADAATKQRLAKHGMLLARCEAEKTPNFGEALTTTLFIVEPLTSDRTDSAFRDLFEPPAN